MFIRHLGARATVQAHFSVSRRLLSSGPEKNVPFGSARWVLALGILPFGYYLGLSWRDGEDEKVKFQGKIQERIQARANEKIAAHEEFLKATKKYASR